MEGTVTLACGATQTGFVEQEQLTGVQLPRLHLYSENVKVILLIRLAVQLL